MKGTLLYTLHANKYISVKDSDGKLESGLMSGNLIAEGSYEQCKNTKEDSAKADGIRGQYVLARWHDSLVWN